MARPTVKLTGPPKQKRGRPANSTNKRAKKWAAFDFYRVFGWIRVTSKSDVLSRVARDCTWLSADRFSQNFYFSTSSSLSHKASVFLLQLSLGQEVFHQRPSTVTGFPPQSPVIGLGGFSSMIWSFETQQLPYGTRIFSFIPRFSFSVQLTGWEVFYQVPIQDSFSNRWLHTQQSLHLRRKAIVMSWSLDLPITWLWHVTTHIIYLHDLNTWPLKWFTHMISTYDLRTSSWYQVIINTNIRVITTSTS